MRVSTVAPLLLVACAQAASIGRRQAIQCADVDKNGTPLTSSEPQDDLVTCTYEGAGPCTYFPANGSFSSGSSDCPAGIAQDPSVTVLAFMVEDIHRHVSGSAQCWPTRRTRTPWILSRMIYIVLVLFRNLHCLASTDAPSSVGAAPTDSADQSSTDDDGDSSTSDSDLSTSDSGLSTSDAPVSTPIAPVSTPVASAPSNSNIAGAPASVTHSGSAAASAPSSSQSGKPSSASGSRMGAQGVVVMVVGLGLGALL
ncbi:hypothetical protein C8F04DRAFT_95865 [Mycena alexandri]|uniref:Uncharacterized protein n=1 Tax=Mycena alexandri TaxID=1745969 RepID=A0AAD6SHW7_9AGAR|nr:hypothetical protein C8F04DRAFT_95865 [Mycena alexandri]